MIRSVYDVGEAHVRLQAPEGWVVLEPRGERVILHDPTGLSPIFVEPLPGVADPETWIERLAHRDKQMTGLQRSATGNGFRLTLSWTSGGARVERAYRIQCVPSHRQKAGVWVAASVDLDGHRIRNRLLGAVFPHLTPAPQLSGEPGLRQYIEDDQRFPDGSATGPGFTLRLPPAHIVRGVTPAGFDIHADGTAVGTLWVSPLLSGDLSIDLVGSRDPFATNALLRRLERGLRVWDAEFRGYWHGATQMNWADWAPPRAPDARSSPPRPAPRPSAPAPPSPQVADPNAAWESRLRGTLLRCTSTSSGGYDPRFAFGGYREGQIVLHATRQVDWNETVHTSATYGGLYVGGPTHTRRTGVWKIETEEGTTRLVLYCGSDGIHRFSLGLTASGDVTLDGQRHRLVRI
jgi:hypothetical protein